MALRAWSGRRIASLWLLGVMFYGGLAILGRRQRREADARFRTTYGLPSEDSQVRADTLSGARRDSSLALLFALWRETSRGTPAHRDSILRQLSAASRDTALLRRRRDSLYRTLEVPAALSPAQHDSLRAAGESAVRAVLGPALRGVDKALEDAAPWIVLTFVLFVVPGAALLATTIAWAFLRRQSVVNTGAPAA